MSKRRYFSKAKVCHACGRANQIYNRKCLFCKKTFETTRADLACCSARCEQRWKRFKPEYPKSLDLLDNDLLLDHMEFSMRASHAFERLKIQTISDLKSNWRMFIAERGVGKLTINEIAQYVSIPVSANG